MFSTQQSLSVRKTHRPQVKRGGSSHSFPFSECPLFSLDPFIVQASLEKYQSLSITDGFETRGKLVIWSPIHITASWHCSWCEN